MYAIVEIAGQQFKVEKDQKIFVHRLEQKEGESIEFENVLLVDDNGKVKVFKKKRRKGYQKLNGHRQDFTQIEIEAISL